MFVKGVVRVIGFDVYILEGVIGEYNIDVMVKVKKIVELFKDYDFVFFYFKLIDVVGYDNNLKFKVEMIEKVDRMIGYIFEYIDFEDVVIVIIGDYLILCEVMNYSGDLVLFFIVGGGVRLDYIESFGERECMCGGIGRIKGYDIVFIMMDFMNRSEKFGV